MDKILTTLKDQIKGYKINDNVQRSSLLKNQKT